MRHLSRLLAFVAMLAARSCQALMMKRPGGTDPVAVELARESVEPTAGSASRFVELSHAAQKHESKQPAGCLEDGCVLTGVDSGVGKTQKKRLQKLAKKLHKKAAEEKKLYLENHSNEEYNVLKEQALVEALERENGGEEGWTGDA